MNDGTITKNRKETHESNGFIKNRVWKPQGFGRKA